LLDGSLVANESVSHLETVRWDVADCCFDIIGDPLCKDVQILVLDVIIDFLHRHASTENGSDSQVPSVARITSGHHVPNG